MTDPRRGIPAIEALLESPPLQALAQRSGRARVAALLRRVQDQLRAAAEGDGAADPPTDPSWYATAIAEQIERADRPRPGPVINATGVVLHTNLGRAPLADAAVRAMVDAAGYAALEYDLETGERGSRQDHCAAVLRDLTGAEAALVVNNNAAAVVLALNTIARDREAVISRGELVEIGGAFRVPEIMARSGAIMREVGATNRTHPADYGGAMGPATAMILKVHRSNFRVEGFTAEVPAAELAALAREAGVALVNDLGSGLLLDPALLGLAGEPTAADAVAAGADVVTMSGDKLLGGPQSGIVLGRADFLQAMRANPLCRALRPDKLTLAALHATLTLYRDPARALRDVPVLRMIATRPDELEERARSLAERLEARGVGVETEVGVSAIGGGAFPGVELPTVVLAVSVPSGAAGAARRLRERRTPVIARVKDGRLVLDLRTVRRREEEALVDAIAAVAAARP